MSLIVRSRGRLTIRHSQYCRTAEEAFKYVDRIMDPREMLSPGVQVEIEEKGQKLGLQITETVSLLASGTSKTSLASTALGAMKNGVAGFL